MIAGCRSRLCPDCCWVCPSAKRDWGEEVGSCWAWWSCTPCSVSSWRLWSSCSCSMSSCDLWSSFPALWVPEDCELYACFKSVNSNGSRFGTPKKWQLKQAKSRHCFHASETWKKEKHQLCNLVKAILNQFQWGWLQCTILSSGDYLNFLPLIITPHEWNNHNCDEEKKN